MTYSFSLIPLSLEACNQGVNGSFHDAEGNPLVNLKTFPNISALPAYAHSKNITASFYMNNCICAEHNFTDPVFIDKIYQRSVFFVRGLLVHSSHPHPPLTPPFPSWPRSSGTV